MLFIYHIYIKKANSQFVLNVYIKSKNTYFKEYKYFSSLQMLSLYKLLFESIRKDDNICTSNIYIYLYILFILIYVYLYCNKIVISVTLWLICK